MTTHPARSTTAVRTTPVLPSHPATIRQLLVERAVRWSQHPLAIPVILAGLMFTIGAQVAGSFAIPSWSNDEPAHFGYIVALSDGRLPTIESPSGFAGRDVAHDHIWTANHPPAFHLLMVPIWWLSSGDIGSAVVAMRLANALGFAVWLVLVAMVARELVPQRPAVTALATTVALAPTLALRSGFLINDGLGSSSALLMMLMIVRMLRGDITKRRLLVGALAGALAAATRAPGVLLVVACVVALLVVGVRRHGWLRGVGAAALIGGIPALVSGGFYIRNYLLYGDFTGQDALLDKFQRLPVDHIGDIFALRTVQETLAASPLPLLALLVLTPAVVISSVRKRGWRVDAAWGFLAGHAALTCVNVATFIAAGGGFHDRYFMQVMPFLATGAAIGMLHLARWFPGEGVDPVRREWQVAACWIAALLVWLAGTLWWMQTRYSFYFADLHGHSPAGDIQSGILIALSLALGSAVIALALRAARTSPATL